MQVVMIGAGYVGLTTGACLAEIGHSVTCVDVDAARIDALNRGEMPIYERGLDELIARNRTAGRLHFSKRGALAAAEADAVFLAVGTPARVDGDADVSYIEAAARNIAPVLKPNAVVVVKSTVAVGTCRRLREIIADGRAGLDFSVASNPEFLREGSAIQDFLYPDRIVIGADDRRASARLEDLYRPLAERGVPIILTGTANAELVKQAANAFLALKIGFINDVADLCEKVGGEIEAVARGIGLDKRIGKDFLSPGPGFGGSCFPKDTRAFAAAGRKYQAPQSLIETLILKNESRKIALARRVLSELGDRPQGASITILGLAFKANTDDVREAPALTMIPILQDAGVTVRAHDPQAMVAARLRLQNVSFFECPYSASRGADVVLILTEWDQYRSLDLREMSALMKGKTLVDYRNLFTPGDVTRHGLRYVCLGRPASKLPIGASIVARGGKKRKLALGAPSRL